MTDSKIEISNLDYFIEKSIEISQNIHNSWQLGSLERKRKLQKLVFPEGIVVDTKYREYLTSKVNSLFLAKSEYKRVSEGGNKKLPIKSDDEESSLVAGVVLPDLRPCESFRGCFTSESLVRCAHYGHFPLTGLANKFAAAKRKNPPNSVRKAFSSRQDG